MNRSVQEKKKKYLTTDSSLKEFLERQTEFMANKEMKIKVQRDINEQNRFGPVIN
jgi:hypothetical protein